MSVIIKNELDPVFETLGLLYVSNLKDWKEELMKELPSFGFEAEAFYNKHYKIVEKYLKVFQKYKVRCREEAFLFNENSRFLFILLTYLASEYSGFLYTKKQPDFMELRDFLAYSLLDSADTPFQPNSASIPKLTDEKAILEFLDSVEDIPEDQKWAVLDLLRKPDKWFQALSTVITANLQAYNKAKEAVIKPLEKLLQQNRCEEDEEFMKLLRIFSSDISVYTSLVLPFVQVIQDTRGYYGILSRYLSANNISGKEDAKERLLRQIKALSDKSKLDILQALKSSRMYNLEISEKLKLSPSTMSHHMNVLLICGFVTVEKEEGKVYYCLNKENIEAFFKNLKNILL